MILFKLLLATCILFNFVIADESNRVLVQFDLVQLDDWKNNVLEALKTTVADSVVKYCQLKVIQCNISSFELISSQSVVIESGYPIEIDKRNTLISLSFALSTQVNNSEANFLNKATLQDAITYHRISIQNFLLLAANEPYEFSYRISYVNNILVLEPSDQTLNVIVTPSVCVFVLLLMILVWGIETCRWKKLLYKANSLTNKVSPQSLVVPSIMVFNEKGDNTVKVESRDHEVAIISIGHADKTT